MNRALEAREAVQQVKPRPTRSKDAVSRSGPLPLAPKPKGKEKGRARKEFLQRWDKTAAGLSEEQQLLAVRQAIDVYSQLPAGSSYARHRLKVLRTALALLEAGCAGRPPRHRHRTP